MKLYHASYTAIAQPDVAHSRMELDFGPGFYLTTIREQAVRYGQKFVSRRGRAVLNTYDFDAGSETWRVLTFDKYDESWLDYVLSCRSGKPTDDYDMIVGGIANDKVFQTVDLYFSEMINKDQALRRLQYEQPNIQYCIRSQKMLDACLHYLNAEEIWKSTPAK